MPPVSPDSLNAPAFSASAAEATQIRDLVDGRGKQSRGCETSRHEKPHAMEH